MSSPAAITMPSATARPVLPIDIQLEILDYLLALGRVDASVSVSIFATVCKFWQYAIERQLFRSLTVNLGDIAEFASYTKGRTHLVKHILLEILIPNERSLFKKEWCFTNITHSVFKVISSWDCHGITLEIGLASPTELINLRSRKRPRFLPSKRMQLLELPSQTIFGGPWEFSQSSWRAKATSLLGNKPVVFQHSTLMPPFLPPVKCISKLLVRRRYLPKVDPITLTVIMTALTCLEFVHIETSAYGKDEVGGAYHSWFLSTFKLPQSVKDISFYEEHSIPYHHRPTATIYTALHTNLTRSLIERTEDPENIAISFACEAEDLFTAPYVSRLKNLKTLALTSQVLILPDDRSINGLLCHVADAAKEMPKLETLELWYLRFHKLEIYFVF
ncbi:hypothetical protein ACHAP8_007568 [Fusarium lateritium]